MGNHTCKALRSLLLQALCIVLVSCGNQIANMPATSMPTYIPVTPSATALPTFTPFVSQAPSPSFTETPFLAATEAPIIPFRLERLRVAYIKDGNLYLRDGTNPSIQLTRSGKDRDPVLSRDGEKIVFYRGEASDTVYSINSDGSREQAIIASRLLPVLGQGEVRHLTFRPGTHELLFNTYLCESRNHLYVFPPCTVSIFSVDLDTGEIVEILAGLSGDDGQGRNFNVSPDGRFLSVATSGHIDLRYISGDLLYQDLMTYPRTIPNEFVPIQYWLPDSSGLIAVLPASKTNEPATPPSAYAVWRYTLDENVAARIFLAPPVIWASGCSFTVSPDGNWILYYGDVAEGLALFIGNLNDGSAQAYGSIWDPNCPKPYSSNWNPDSEYFAFSEVLGTTDGRLVPITGRFMGWIDASHYFFQAMQGNILIGEIGGPSISLPEDFEWSPAFVILPPKAEQ